MMHAQRVDRLAEMAGWTCSDVSSQIHGALLLDVTGSHAPAFEIMESAQTPSSPVLAMRDMAIGAGSTGGALSLSPISLDMEAQSIDANSRHSLPPMPTPSTAVSSPSSLKRTPGMLSSVGSFSTTSSGLHTHGGTHTHSASTAATTIFNNRTSSPVSAGEQGEGTFVRPRSNMDHLRQRSSKSLPISTFSLPSAIEAHDRGTPRKGLIRRLAKGVRSVLSLARIGRASEYMEEVKYDEEHGSINAYGERRAGSSTPRMADGGGSSVKQADTARGGLGLHKEMEKQAVSLATLAAGPQRMRSRRVSRPMTAGVGGSTPQQLRGMSSLHLIRPKTSAGTTGFSRRPSDRRLST